jgi:hypothetical protein
MDLVAGQFMNFEPEVLSDYISNETIAARLEGKLDDTIRAELAARTPKPIAEALDDAKEYMAEYGWPKASGHRGISATRTIQKMRAWFWLLGDDEVIDWCDDGDLYPMYGAPVLKRICEKYGWPIPTDDGVMRMIQGLPCDPDCENGCQ